MQQLGEINRGACRVRCQRGGLIKQIERPRGVSTCRLSCRLFAQVVRLAGAEVALARTAEPLGNFACIHPVTGALIDRKQGEPGLFLKCGVLQPAQGGLGPVKQAGLEEIKGQRVLSPVALGLGQVAARQQVFMHTHSAIVLTAPTKQIAEGKVQLGGVGVVLNGFDEGVNGLVLLLVEQKIQALEIGFGCLPVLDAKLP